MRRGEALSRVCAVLLVLMVLSPWGVRWAVADSRGADGGDRERVRDRVVAGHGWIVQPETSLLGFPTTVLHIPPRGGWGGVEGARAGDMVVALGLERTAERWACWDSTVYAVLAPDRAAGIAGGWSWRVQSVTAVPLGKGWTYADGRAQSLGSLALGPVGASTGPTDVTSAVLDFAASGRGPIAVLGAHSRGSEGARSSELSWSEGVLQRWSGRGWDRLALPWQIGGESEAAPPLPGWRCLLGGLTNGIGLLMVSPDGGEGHVWIGAMDMRPSNGMGPPVPIGWARQEVRWRGSLAGVVKDPGARLMTAPGAGGYEDVLVLIWRDGGALEVGAIPIVGRPLMLDQVVRLDGVGDQGRVTVLARSGDVQPRVVVATRGGDAASAGRTLDVREISLLTGRVLYAGAARNTGGLVTRQYLALAIVLVATMGMVLLFVLRPEAGATQALPTGVSPAGGIVRAMASSIDAAFGALVASTVMGLPLRSVLDVLGVVSGAIEVGGPLVGLGFTALHCAIGESIGGQSLGKLVLGIRVVALRGGTSGGDGLERASVKQIAIRNLIRWGLPIVGMAVFLDGDRRHAGDLAAGTRVISEHADEESDEEA